MRGRGELGVLFLCQLIFCGWILIRFDGGLIDMAENRSSFGLTYAPTRDMHD